MNLYGFGKDDEKSYEFTRLWRSTHENPAYIARAKAIVCFFFKKPVSPRGSRFPTGARDCRGAGRPRGPLA